MLKRLQVLVTGEQKSRLAEKAKENGTSMGEVVRDAIDAQLALPSREERIRAAEELIAIGERNPRPAPTPEEINRMVEEEREAKFPELFEREPERHAA